MTPFKLVHISRLSFISAGVAAPKRSRYSGEYVSRTSSPFLPRSHWPGAPRIPGYHFFIASEPRTTYIFAGGLSPVNTMGAVSGVSCIAVTIFAIISMPLGDKGLSWRKAKEMLGEDELECELEEEGELELEEEAVGEEVLEREDEEEWEWELELEGEEEWEDEAEGARTGEATCGVASNVLSSSTTLTPSSRSSSSSASRPSNRYSSAVTPPI